MGRLSGLLNTAMSIAAVWGAVTGTAGLLWQMMAERRRLKVTASVGDWYADGMKVGENRLSIRAYNVGKRPIGLNKAGLMAPRRSGMKSVMIIPNRGALPCVLEPGQSTSVWTNLEHIRLFRYQFDYAFFSDEAGRLYYVDVPWHRRILRWFSLRYGR